MTPAQIIHTLRHYGYSNQDIAVILVQLGHKAPR
jgi:hypothetical protein